MKKLNKWLLGGASLGALALGFGAAEGAGTVIPNLNPINPGFQLIDGGLVNNLIGAANMDNWAFCASDCATLTSTTSANPVFNGTTNGAVLVNSSTQYEFEANYVITNTGTTSHTWAVLFGGTATITAGSMTCNAVSSTSSAVAAASQGWTSTLATAFVVTAASTSATENATIHCWGVVQINAGGTWIPQLKSSAATGQTAVVKAGSYYLQNNVGPANTVAIGPWS
jgi:hypothetical protein